MKKKINVEEQREQPRSQGFLSPDIKKVRSPGNEVAERKLICFSKE